MKILPSLIKHLADGVGGGLLWFLANLDNSMDTKDKFSGNNNNNSDADGMSAGVLITIIILILIFHTLMAMASYNLTENKVIHVICTFFFGTFWIMFVWIYFGVFSNMRLVDKRK